MVAVAPAIEEEFYHRIISESNVLPERVKLVKHQTYALLSHATLALVTSGTATLETALFRVPQVVCYYMRCGWLVSRIRPYFLKVPFISLVNLIAGEEVVPELVAADMNVATLTRHLRALLPRESAERRKMLEGYDRMACKLGNVGAPEQAAHQIIALVDKL